MAFFEARWKEVKQKQICDFLQNTFMYIMYIKCANTWFLQIKNIFNTVF